MDGKICIWDINTCKLRTACFHQEGVVKVKFADEWNLVSSISLDGTLRLWDCRSGECAKSFYGHQQPILDFAFDINSGLFVTASDDKCALVFKK
jgi:WD40 repeat protein